MKIDNLIGGINRNTKTALFEQHIVDEVENDPITKYIFYTANEFLMQIPNPA